MKSLICARDVEVTHDKGVKTILVDENTIITPSAKDVAKAMEVQFVYQEENCSDLMFQNEFEDPKISNKENTELDSEMIYKALLVLKNQGLLENIINSVLGEQPYSYEKASNGIKVVRGQSVKFKPSYMGVENHQLKSQELVGKDEGTMNSGFFIIDHTSFYKKVEWEEMNYITEGSVSISIDGHKIHANKGDVVHIPAGSSVTRASMDKAKVFYTICQNVKSKVMA
ncbi:conserved hypothetical protein [Alkaliphilus metalliredigens QYMF]|uniref:Ethanolamine utilization EutQ family protein n=1 Tax=Alkaliphilus metalliredigens (strain QYMF) TaxID=293826 RepID=A6TUS5_ALKMQ|nr:cupin domain-containing protein [Alkaliphilus metalliredigens]ABR49943.1 conserved hypothetical protein [Alkaliphilus metalliredigens QYMF]